LKGKRIIINGTEDGEGRLPQQQQQQLNGIPFCNKKGWVASESHFPCGRTDDTMINVYNYLEFYDDDDDDESMIQPTTKQR
jgi:hypothetical protein